MDALEKYEKKVIKLIEKRDKSIRDIARLMCYDTNDVLDSCNCAGSINFSYDFHGGYYILTIYPTSEDSQIDLAINFYKRIARRLDNSWLVVNKYKSLDQLSKDIDQDLIAAQSRLQARQPILYRRGA